MTGLRVDAEILIDAPPPTVEAIYVDVEGWPDVYPKIRGVHLVEVGSQAMRVVVEHAEGTVLNELEVRPDEVVLRETKRRYDAVFVTRFVARRAGTRCMVSATVRLKGLARMLRPVPTGYIRHQIMRWQLQPLKAFSEACRQAPDGTVS